MNKIEYALECFKNIQDLIKFIDQKAGAVLVIASLIFTSYLEFSKDLELSSLETVTFLGVITLISSIVTFLSLVVIIYISIFKVLKPRLAKNYSDEELSLFYFEHLVKMGKSGIDEKYKELEESTILKSITDQQFEVSTILKQKTKYLSNSFLWLFISVISLMIFIICSNQL